MSTDVIGLDIGGANLKAHHRTGVTRSVPFALWKQPAKLANALEELLTQLPPAARLALTMTGELCDCFPSKRVGVEHIVRAAQHAAGSRTVDIWLTTGQFVTPEQAITQPLAAAAANWHALATCLARRHPQENLLLVDTGSTTTDIIPLVQGRVAAQGLTDTGRLAQGELVYVGARRTPLMALGPRLTLDDVSYPLMAEWFASSMDVSVLLGELPEDAQDRDTADSQPLTRAAARLRIARMIGGDHETLSVAQQMQLAQAFAQRMVERIRAGIEQVRARVQVERAVIAGSGAWLARRAWAEAAPQLPQRLLAEELGVEAAGAACAWALTQL